MADEVVVAYDASAVVVNPDRSKDADQAWDRGAIGYSAVSRLHASTRGAALSCSVINCSR